MHLIVVKNDLMIGLKLALGVKSHHQPVLVIHPELPDWDINKEALPLLDTSGFTNFRNAELINYEHSELPAGYNLSFLIHSPSRKDQTPAAVEHVFVESFSQV